VNFIYISLEAPDVEASKAEGFSTILACLQEEEKKIQRLLQPNYLQIYQGMLPATFSFHQ
jgi:hypothetical protein